MYLEPVSDGKRDGFGVSECRLGPRRRTVGIELSSLSPLLEDCGGGCVEKHATALNRDEQSDVLRHNFTPYGRYVPGEPISTPPAAKADSY